MISIANINLPLDYTKEDLIKKCAKLLHVKESDILKIELLKKSLDARKKDNLVFVLKVDIELKKGVSYNKNVATPSKKLEFKVPLSNKEIKIMIVGSGPAGLFFGIDFGSCRPKSDYY